MIYLPLNGCFLQKALKDCNLPEAGEHPDVFSNGIMLLFKGKQWGLKMALL
jgi:hypothetical protein